METKRYEVRGALAGAYRESNPKSYLTHAVEVNDHGIETAVLCSRVLLDSICDVYGTPEGERHLPPTCPVCAKRLAKRVADGTLARFAQ